MLRQPKALRYRDDCRHVARDQRRPLRRLQLLAVGIGGEIGNIGGADRIAMR